MATTKRASPKPGRLPGSNGPTQDETLQALAQEILDKEQIAKATDRRKVNRGKYELAGGDLGHLDILYRKRDDSASEITSFLQGLFNTLSASFTDLTQMDLLTPKTTRTEAAGFNHHGVMAALKGEPPTPPPNLNAAESNDWMKGHKRGSDARAKANSTLADQLAAAMANADAGLVTDGKTGAAIDPDAKPLTEAQKVGEQAAKDFAEDNPEVIAKQTTRAALKAQKGADAPDPDEVAKAAAKLKASGFTDKPAALPGEKSQPVNLAK